MPERSSKRKARRESITSSVDEAECSSMRTGNVPSISDKDFADLTEKIEKSVNKRIKDTETGQREILKMIENLSSKIDSLTYKTSCDLNQGLKKVSSENVMLENRPIELNEFQQDISQHIPVDCMFIIDEPVSITNFLNCIDCFCGHATLFVFHFLDFFQVI